MTTVRPTRNVFRCETACHKGQTAVYRASSLYADKGGVIPAFWVRRGFAVVAGPPLNSNA